MKLFEEAAVMGILNRTPDSFYAGSRIMSPAELTDKAGRMLDQGASMLDLGGVSTRPGAAAVAEDEEIERVIPALQALRKAFPEAVISIDTWRSNVAREAVRQGADIINDISAGRFDILMPEAIAELNVPIVLMHTSGKPEIMQKNTDYGDVVLDVLRDLSGRVLLFRQLGVSDIIIDPGFGFGKTLEQNFRLLSHLDKFRFHDLPVMVGLSRKSMIYKLLGTTPDGALGGTTAAHMIALGKGANILRVHDVKEAVDAVRIFSACSYAMKEES